MIYLFVQVIYRVSKHIVSVNLFFFKVVNMSDIRNTGICMYIYSYTIDYRKFFA